MYRTILPSGLRSVLRLSKGTGEMNSMLHSRYTVESALLGGVIASDVEIWLVIVG